MGALVVAGGLVLSGEAIAQATRASDATQQTWSTTEGSAADDVVKLPAFVLEEQRVANDLPASTFAAPVSTLRFEPRVDMQTRNFAEAQGDISIRGGIFEGTAVQVGGFTLYDPQTGHYSAEVPISPEMLEAPEVLTGVDHAFAGMQATAGTLSYRWREIRTGGNMHAGVGSGGLRRASLRAAEVLTDGRSEGGVRVAAEAEAAFSSADGTIANGDHEFFRAAARVQVDSSLGRTQLFAGQQEKFFGWPNLYTPFGVAETEDLHTTLLIVSHRQERGDLVWETAVHHRRNKDDYEFDRFRPGLFNPYEHDTRTSGVLLRAQAPLAGWNVEGRAELTADEIASTALGEHARTYWKLGAVASRAWGGDGGEDAGPWRTRFGVTLDDTNRDASAVSPLAEVAWSPNLRGATVRPRWYAQYSESTRVPGYTALYSAPGAGLFRGNPELGREQARNLETGLQFSGGSWSLHAAVFRRRDDPLVDWTFTAGAPNARSARPVQIDNTGVELVGSASWGPVHVIAGYSWLRKDADYLGATVDASFYALNFPEHRLTLAVIARLAQGLELRVDNEFRVQEPNLLRTVGGDDAWFTSVGVYWRIPGTESLELSLVADNLWQSDFQELPAVPAPGRQVTLGAGWRW